MSERNSESEMSSSINSRTSTEWVSVEIVAARAGITTRRVRYLERAGIVESVDEETGSLRYSEETIQRVIQVERLVNDLGVNLAGAEVIMNMRERMIALLDEIDQLQRNKL